MKKINTLLLLLLVTLTSCSDHIHGSKSDGVTANSTASRIANAIPAVQYSSLSMVSGNLIADGSSMNQIKVSLRNKDNQPVANLKFKVKISGNGNDVTGCTKTDTQGIAYCWFSSHFAEYKVFQVYDPLEVGLPIHFLETDSSVLWVGDIVSSSSVEYAGSQDLFSTSGAFVDSTLMQDSSNNWVVNNMHGILHSRGF